MKAPTVPGYHVLGPLGSGGSGQVWRARRLADGLAVALKVVRPGGGQVAVALAEAGLLAGLRHPHLIHLYDVLPLDDDDGVEAVVLVTQLAAGGSLAQVLAQRHLLSPGELVTVLHPLCTVLAYLHRCGVVHGDLSSGNVVFRSDGMPLLADLGTARVVGEVPLREMGTDGPDGMVAPEVVEGFPATSESDVYQVGALAWLALVGQPPGPGFVREPLAQVAPALSPVVVDLITRCLAPEPEDRPDAEEVASALVDIAPPEPIEVAPDVDVAQGVTRRLRQEALEDAEGAGPDRGGRWRRARWRRRTGAHRHRRGEQPDDGPGAGGTGDEQQGTGRPAALLTRALAGLIVLALGFMVSTVLWPGPGRSGTEEPGATTQPLVRASTGTSVDAVVTSTPGADTAPVQEDLQALLEVRAQAWEAVDPALLGEVVAPGSPAERLESAELTRAQVAGLSYDDVDFQVESMEVLQAEEGGYAVEALVRRAPLEVRDADGVVAREPEQVRRVQMDLVQVDGGWRLLSWTEQGS